MNDDPRAMVDRIAFCSGLSDKARTALASSCRVVELAPGRTFFREGAVHERLYLIESGRVALDMDVPVRGTVRILSLGPGDLLGWSSFCGVGAAASAPRMTATAVATEPTRALAVSGADLRRLCESDHEFGYQFLLRMSDALSRRLLATRLQWLDLFAETQPRG